MIWVLLNFDRFMGVYSHRQSARKLQLLPTRIQGKNTAQRWRKNHRDLGYDLG